MRKNRYRYKRYLLYLPKVIGDLIDTRVDYVVQLFGPAIVLLPKGLEDILRLNGADAQCRAGLRLRRRNARFWSWCSGDASPNSETYDQSDQE